MICISLTAQSNKEMVKLLAQASGEPADLHEIRMDDVREPVAVEELVAISTRPVVACCRSRQSGGKFDGSAAERRDLLVRAARAGARCIDAEAVDVPYIVDKVKPAILMASMYDTVGTPENLASQIKDLATLPADWVKFSVTHRRPIDSVRVFEALRAAPKPCVGTAMGDGGLMTRVLGLAYGSEMVYASLEPGYESAPGQPTARDYSRVYRVKELTTDTPVYGLLGNPVAHSRSFRLHNRAFAKLGLDAVYIPFRTESAEEFFDAIPPVIRLRGLSVTMPHKPAALRWADYASESAQRIGTANTLTRTKKGWRADNTDCAGAFESIKDAVANARINLTNAEALVLGAGGTTRAVGLALTLLGCRVTVAARNPEQAWRAASQMDWEVAEWEEAPYGSWRVVANTTPVGMYPNMDETPFPASGWKAGMLAFDAVHNPQETRFLRDAAAAGALTVDGVEMFLRQTQEQFRMWTGEAMPKISSLT